ncbi:uncharacterized protein LAESUDRAFT_685590, partial [Laetiporus sulphureus 93-53]
MAEIYSDLHSPQSHPQFLVHQVHGMRSGLYPYQQQSVSAMLARESVRSSIADPLYIPLEGIDGSCFYLQPATMEVLHECPRRTPPCGGILCEELGTGKTVMILALILMTLDRLPEPEESLYLDARPVLTPIAFRHFPSEKYADARERIQIHSHQRLNSSPGVPTLVECLLHFCQTQPDQLQMREHQELLEQQHLWKPLSLNRPFYHQYKDMIPDTTHGMRRQADPGPRTMFLSSATLIIVPANLFLQWRSEIMKHCHDILRVLEVRAEAALSDACTLASSFDAKRDSASPLLQVRWKRLVVDEGHISGAVDTSFMQFAKALSVERRWIVTGTPTTNLLGLHFGEGSELQYPDDPPTDTTLSSEENTPFDESVDPDIVARQWTADDRQDLRKLSIMISQFLGMRQFAAEAHLFDTHVIQPLMNRPTPCPGAIKVLTQVMESVMIRHRIEDVEQDVLLPLLQQETVLLDLDPYALKSYNAMQAAIIVNAVDSERIDRDYLFHPRNAAMLAQTIENMSQVMFWHCDDERMFNVDEIASNADSYLRTAGTRNVTDRDRVLLKEAMVHVKSAANDHVWRAFQTNFYIQHRVCNIPLEVYKAWTMLPQHPVSSSITFLASDRLQKLTTLVMNRPLSQIYHLVAHGRDVHAEERHRLELERLQLPHSQTKGKVSKKKDSTPRKKEQQVVKQIDTQEKREEVQREFNAAQKRLLAYYQDDSDQTLPNHCFGSTVPSGTISPLLSSSPLAAMRLKNSTSSKLDYILNEVHQYSSAEKFLIFSRSPLTLAYVAEGLELTRTRFLYFKGQRRVREHLVTTFETSELYRVFLMELKHGARGLNLVTASRVIFCEPVWQADVETQAIKTKPVTVKTLAIRGTAEEAMVTRREALKQRGGKQIKMLDDLSMRDFIANPIFLQEASSTRLELDIPLFNIATSSPDALELDATATNFAASRQDAAGAGTASESVAEGKKPRSVKRKAVRFGSDEEAPDQPTTGPSRSQTITTSEERPPKKRRVLKLKFDGVVIAKTGFTVDANAQSTLPRHQQDVRGQKKT